MLTLEKQRFSAVIKKRGLSLNRLAADCRVSRQSIYNMLKGGSVFNTTFEKMLDYLGVGFEEVTVREDELAAPIMKNAPQNVRDMALELSVFGQENNTPVFLFGSRARGKTGTADWDFGVSTPDTRTRKKFIPLKQRLIDMAFPYRVDIVDVTMAPDWFIESIEDDIVPLTGGWKKTAIKRRRI